MDEDALAQQLTKNTMQVYGRWDDNPVRVRTNPVTGQPWDELEPSPFHES